MLGNNKSCKILGIGSVRIKMFDGMERLLQGVRFVPELKRNLISLGTFDQNGFVFKAEGGILKHLKGALVVMKGRRNNGLYSLIGCTIIGSVAFTSTQHMDKAQLWHRRLGHVSEKGLIELSNQGAWK